MEALYTYLRDHQLSYVTLEREKGQGFPFASPNYSIFANENGSQNNKSTRELITEFTNPDNASILVFKPTKSVEQICRERNWRLLNPSAELAYQVENKVTQVRWLGELARYLPEHWLGELIECNVTRPFVLQFATGHSGEGTFLIESEQDLANHIKQFPRRLIRASRLITGQTYTNNNVVTSDSVLIGNISLQITGEPELTNNKIATVGNDWGLANSKLTNQDKLAYNKIARDIGEKLRESGWKGLFGIDVIKEERTNRMYLIEINARQHASACFESSIQDQARKAGFRESLPFVGIRAQMLTTFEAHLASLLRLPLTNNQLIPITSGRREINRLVKSEA